MFAGVCVAVVRDKNINAPGKSYSKYGLRLECVG